MKTKLNISLIIFAIFSLIAISSFSQTQENIVKQVIDGNTIILDTNETVRYIGVGVTPDNKESFEYNKGLVEGKKVKLEFDTLKNNDKGHILAYVYQDDIFINAKMIESGHGSVIIVSPNIKYAERFLTLEREARQAKRGMWSESVVNTNQSKPLDENNVLLLEKRISILEAEIKELKDKIEQLTQAIKDLQSPKETKQEISAKANEKTTNDNSIVYVSSKSGKKYHKQGCKFLSDDSKQLKLEEAKKRGYEPCKICFPEFSKEDKKGK